jgi:PAT family beta-lactamase induction signal transducer AmpG
MQNPPVRRILHPLAWVPSAYFAEGIPFALVIWVAGTLFKDLGHDDAQITLATGSIAIAWRARS